MFSHTITLFNFHAGSGKWYPTVFEGVQLINTKSNSASNYGMINADSVKLIMLCRPDMSVVTREGDSREYIGPKKYAESAEPESNFTFKPETDFIYDGVWHDLDPVAEEDYESGLYHELNDDNDGIYLITSAVYYPLLPHFEIGGR